MIIYATAKVTDPDLGDNGWSGKAVVNVLGTGPLPTTPPEPLPTPTPGDPVIDDPIYIPSPAAPTASPDSGATGGASSDSEDPSVATGNSDVVLGIGSNNTPTPRALAAALPSTGASGERGFPGWAYPFLFGGAVALSASLAIAMKSIFKKHT